MKCGHTTDIKTLKADDDWLCMTTTKNEPCPEGAINICKKQYPNLKCYKNAR